MRRNASYDAPGAGTGENPPLLRATPYLKAAMLSDPGRERTLNEDAALIIDVQGGALLAVADGMGGHAAGEVASKLALEELRNAYHSAAAPAPERLALAVQAANEAVYRHATGTAAGMGTTLTAILIDSGAALIANVGDSRAYLYRAGKLARLTRDHSWVAEQVRLGFLSEQEARTHQWRNVVSNALGGEERVRLDLLGAPLERGDRLLICSDGLTSVVDDHEIAEMLGRTSDLATLLPELIHAANARGGPDNITAIVVDIRTRAPRPRYTLPTLHAEGPVDITSTRAPLRKRSLTYLTLATLYLTLFGMIVLPEHLVLITAIGALALAALLLIPRLRRLKRHRDIPTVPQNTPQPSETRPRDG